MDESDFYTNFELQAWVTFERNIAENNSRSSNTLSCLGNKTSQRIKIWMDDLLIRQPSTETILKWNESFATCIKHKAGYRLFHKFLCKEFSEDNLMFWIQCEKYKTRDQKSKRDQMAQHIYDNFVAPGSPHEMNLNHKVRRTIEMDLESAQKSLFNEAQLQIQILMENDSYKRFVQSVLKTLTAKENKRTVTFRLRQPKKRDDH